MRDRGLAALIESVIKRMRKRRWRIDRVGLGRRAYKSAIIGTADSYSIQVTMDGVSIVRDPKAGDRFVKFYRGDRLVSIREWP